MRALAERSFVSAVQPKFHDFEVLITSTDGSETRLDLLEHCLGIRRSCEPAGRMPQCAVVHPDGLGLIGGAKAEIQRSKIPAHPLGDRQTDTPADHERGGIRAG